MNLSAPKTVTFIVALVLALVGLLAAVGILSFIPPHGVSGSCL